MYTKLEKDIANRRFGFSAGLVTKKRESKYSKPVEGDVLEKEVYCIVLGVDFSVLFFSPSFLKLRYLSFLFTASVLRCSSAIVPKVSMSLAFDCRFPTVINTYDKSMCNKTTMCGMTHLKYKYFVK